MSEENGDEEPGITLEEHMGVLAEEDPKETIEEDQKEYSDEEKLSELQDLRNKLVKREEKLVNLAKPVEFFDS